MANEEEEKKMEEVRKKVAEAGVLETQKRVAVELQQAQEAQKSQNAAAAEQYSQEQDIVRAAERSRLRDAKLASEIAEQIQEKNAEKGRDETEGKN
jgi:hypothetical protein